MGHDEIEGDGNIAIHGKHNVPWGMWCVRRSRVMAILPYMGNTMCHVVRDEIEGDGNIAIHGKYNVTWGLLCVTRSRVMAILPYMGNTL